MVVPIFNHEPYVGDAIRSIREQGDLVGEIILVDDGSTDRSAAVAVEAVSGISAPVISWSQPNRGAHHALNAGLARASLTYVAILNSDDRWAPGRLEALVAALAPDPTIGLVASAVRSVDGDGAPIANDWYENALRFAAAGDDLGTALLNGNILVTTSNFLFRRAVLDRVGGFAPLRYAHDLDWALRLLAGGYRIVRSDTVLLDYRVHGRNTIAEDHAGVRYEWALAAGAYLAQVLDDAAEHRASSWDRASRLLAVLERHRIAHGATLVAAYLRRERSRSLERSAIADDQGFAPVLQRVL